MVADVWKRRNRAVGIDFILLFQLIVILDGRTRTTEGELNITDQDINASAINFGFHLQLLANGITYVDSIHKGFERTGARVQMKDGIGTVIMMTSDIEKMMAWKVQAVQRITETAEEAMMGHVFDPNLEITYNNAKLLNTERGVWLRLTPDEHFSNIPVNTTNSSVHVPDSVSDKDADVVNAIRSSEHLNPIFQSNYYLDPSLSWQYFCSSTGFLRLYPAMGWDRSEAADNYDCRLRPWYIKAATSPKDMVILLDNGENMSGANQAIAVQVVLSILNTLTDNDYFTVYRFGETAEDVVPCFNDTLVPANVANIREFKNALRNVAASKGANASVALITAFEILQKYNRSNEGSMCNHVVMLITDGASQSLEEVFTRYNHPDRRVRVFTYLVGEDKTDEKRVKDLACSNRGYYAHVRTLDEARDQVLKYIPVMARPLNLYQRHSIIWTSVYGDTEMPNFSWERQKELRRGLSLQLDDDLDYLRDDEDPNLDLSIVNDFERNNNNSVNSPWMRIFPLNADSDSLSSYNLLTTVACPVLDRRNSTGRVPHILGVAGTDVPIEEITKLTPAYKLGVNGYSFAISNNGRVLFHPDFRPMYISRPPLLKPDYNGVDFSEIELQDNDLPPKTKDAKLLHLRKKIIDHREAGHTRLTVKTHLDDMRRVVTRTQNYFYAPLKDTPFSLGIVMPEGYGMHEVVGSVELKKHTHWLDYKRKVLNLFDGDKWRIHPDWIYCRYIYGNSEHSMGPIDQQQLLGPRPQAIPPSERLKWTREKALHNFLRQIHYNRAFNWKSQHRVKPLPRSEDYSYDNAKKINKNEFYCDKDLLQSLVFDADATKGHGQGLLTSETERLCQISECSLRLTQLAGHLSRAVEVFPGGDISSIVAKMNGITVSFLATRSGLTRWKEFDPEGRSFIQKNTRAIDELWYRRAVDYNSIDNASFVLSVPFDAGMRDDALVTVSHTIFLNTSRLQAAAAVVGFQMKHSHLVSIFMNITCKNTSECNLMCKSENLNCYLLDNNGFIIVSERHSETGRFYGEIDHNIMNALVQDQIYRRIHMIDYQAVCFDWISSEDSSSILLTPFRQVAHLMMWTWSKLLLFLFNYNFFNWQTGRSDQFAHAAPSYDGYVISESKYSYRFVANSKAPKPCDKEYYLYQLQLKRFADKSPRRGKLYGCSASGMQTCNKSFVVHLVPNTNLLLLVVNATCTCETSSFNDAHKEVVYNESYRCRWLNSNLHRRRPNHCVSYHEQELDIKGHCGRASRLAVLRERVMLVAFSTMIVVSWLSGWSIST